MSCADCETCAADVPAPSVVADVCRHELHVTVHLTGALAQFRNACESRDLHPVVMAIRSLDGSLHAEWMTRSSYEGTDAEARRVLAAVGDDLVAEGYQPVRAKIEAAPWHPRAKLRGYGYGLPADSYWESHLGLWLRPDQIERIHRVVYLANGYLSLNRLKPGRGVGHAQQFRWSATLRSEFLSRENQASQCAYVAGELRDLGADVDEEIRHEWTWWDSCYDPAMLGGPPGGSH